MSKHWSITGDSLEKWNIAIAKNCAQCWISETHKKKFLEDPRGVMDLHGVELPAEMDVKAVDGGKVFELNENGIVFGIPKKPDFDELLEGWIARGDNEIPRLSCIICI